MAKRKVVHIDEEKCVGCGLCIPSCEEGALQIIDGKAKLVDERHCDGLGNCIGSCPRGAIAIIEKEVEDFVGMEEGAEKREGEEKGPCCGHDQKSSSGCPSSRSITLDSGGDSDASGVSVESGDVSISVKSQLKNWPIQMFLINPEASYLKNADLLLAADCVPAVLPLFHLEMLKGKILIMNCPKQGDQTFYINKLMEIIKKNSIKGITVAYMDLACCTALLRAVLKAVEQSGVEVPVYAVKVGMDGKTGHKNMVYSKKGA
ncbi:MAG: 4Fe-4S dicluster domain-containing protein [Clostridia bacterium]|nr:4Fe-4S dicluster domain-containing protein [Clostridia bacterium]